MTFWIDAISINQKDVAERNDQVRRMTSIYKHALAICIWLGPAADDSDLAMDLLFNTGECIDRTNNDLPAIAAFLGTQKGVEMHEGELTFEADLLSAMVKLFKRSWWSRAWIVQEATVPNNRRTFILCGNKHYWFSQFGRAVATIAFFASHETMISLDLMDSHAFTLFSFLIERGLIRDKLDLFTLLVQFRRHEATDKRDLVYALIGMAQDASNDLLPKPDYNKPFKDVCTEFTRYLMRITPYGQNLDILGYCDDYILDVPSYHDLSTNELIKSLPQIVVEFQSWLVNVNFTATEEEMHDASQKVGAALRAAQPFIKALWASLGTSKNEAGLVKLTSQERGHVKLLLQFVEKGIRSDDEMSTAEKKGFLELSRWFPTVQPDLITWVVNHPEHFVLFGQDVMLDLILNMSELIEHIPVHCGPEDLEALEALDISDSDMMAIPLGPQDWPSWVPDWRMSSTQSNPLSKRKDHRPFAADDKIMPYQNLYFASGADAAVLEEHIGSDTLLSFDDDEMHIYGFQVDKIHDLRSLLMFSLTSDSEIKSELLLWVSFALDELQDKAMDYHNLKDALDRTLTADITCTAARKSRLPLSGDVVAEPERSTECTGRLLTVSTGGAMVLVPFSARPGDGIYLLAGGQVFYVLRPESTRKGCFRLIGEAYIHGLMDGEVLGRLESGDARLQKLRIC